ncbi:phytoene desaturase family protein [Phocaeicola sartorii]|uniref:phytoene desaturase family protein n=1 Tax=Phocaeicola sartorii TaxID=671267 RepID=UPI0025940342|nr:FAD-dependent oxidoreductase [Phocaeicola sartorii]
MGKNIIIIGGGLGGLMTGAFLAKEKYTVTVLEKNHIIGGGLQCFHRYGTVFETGMHILGGFMPGNNLHKICTYLGIIDKLHIRHTDADCMDSVTFGVNGKTYSLPRGREAFESYLAQCFPDQAEGIHRYMDALWALSEEVDLFYLRPDGESMLREHSEEFLMPADDFIGKYIANPVLAELLAYMNPMYAGVAGHTPAFVHALINVLYINGSSMFVDGSQQMADALAEVITSAGGAVHAGEPVVEIAVDDHMVRQVLTKIGKTYVGDLYISDIHPCTLLDLLPEKAFLRSYRNRLQEIPNSYSSFSVYIKFKKDAHQPFVNHPCYFQEEHGHVWHLYEYEEASFPRGFMYLTTPVTNQGPWADRMTVNCPMPFSAVAQWAKTTLGHRTTEYEAWKERMLQCVLAKLERLRPGICADIDFCFASSPLTIRDYYGTKAGALYGYSRDCKNMMLSQLPIATKVRNLLLTGQNINLHGICGVPLTAIETVESIVGIGNVVRKINEAYDKRKDI